MYVYKCIHTAPYNTIALGLGHTITDIEPDGFNNYIVYIYIDISTYRHLYIYKLIILYKKTHIYIYINTYIYIYVCI
jgi:hypothetical protein